MKKIAWIPLLALLFTACTKNDATTEHYLIFKFKFDATQERLNATGGASIMPLGNAAVSPQFNSMSAHYVEISDSDSTKLGKGVILYKAPEYDSAIDFENSMVVKEGETFLAVPLSTIAKGSYKWLRVSLAYQNYDVPFRLDTTINGVAFNSNYMGTIASFLGYETYIKKYTIKDQSLTINTKKKQGYWGFETTIGNGGINYPAVTKTGQAPALATTVVNPLFASSPIPDGSCVVTGLFNKTVYNKDGTFSLALEPLNITGKETQSIIIECSLSTNNSFEWREIVNNGLWDVLKGEQVIDMGIRGMKPIVK